MGFIQHLFMGVFDLNNSWAEMVRGGIGHGPKWRVAYMTHNLEILVLFPYFY